MKRDLDGIPIGAENVKIWPKFCPKQFNFFQKLFRQSFLSESLKTEVFNVNVHSNAVEW